MPPRSSCRFTRSLAALAGVLLLAGGALAQSVDRESLQPCESPTFAGTYYWATQTFVPAAPGQTSSLGAAGLIYDNTCPTNYFSSIVNGGTIIDDGRIPSATSPSPNTGTLNNYRVNKFQFAYCTRDLDGVAIYRTRFWADHNDCATLASAPTPNGDFTFQAGLPGSSAPPAVQCWLIDVDLTGGGEFCMRGDANGAYDDGTDLLDGAGFGFTISGQTGTSTAASGGIYIAGLPSACVQGDNTYYKNPGAGTGTGLDNSDLIRRDGTPPQTSGCIFFGGPPVYAGWHLKIEADINDCTTCPGNPNADGDSAPDCVDGCPNDPAKIAPGQCGCGVADTDSDGDTVANCIDNCDNLPNVGQDDCNNDGIGDACAILGGAPDCNNNGIPDSCDIADLTSEDDDGNTVPDECQQNGGSPFCFGSSGCPCGNDSDPSENAGCANGTGLGGKLTGSGNTQVSSDGLVLTGTNLTGLIGVVFQGTGVNNLTFGDGRRCFAGTVIRIGTAALSGGTGSYPPGGGPISVEGSVPPAGGVRYYQMIYRSGTGPCATGLNITNGISVVWQP